MQILIVDNSESGLSVLTTALIQLGHTVRSAVTAEQAIECFLHHRPDIIILDGIMQQMSNFHCTKELRKMSANDWIPILFLNTSVDDHSIEQGMEAGVDDYLEKPFSPLALATKIRAMQRIVDMQKKLYEITQQFSTLSSTDVLTGIHNRLQFEKAINEQITDSKQSQTKLALLLLDLDHFKDINDHLGHHIGDLLLKEVAFRIKACLSENDIVSRLGGDEFAIIITKIKHFQEANLVAQKILDALRDTLHLATYHIHISCSIGIAFYPAPDTSSENIIEHADMAMSCAKALGRNNFQHYASHDQPEYERRFLLDHALRFALENNEFFLCYQPIYQLRTKKMVGMEALMRWKSPQFGIITPDIFIPLAEEIGLMTQIGKWAFIHICQQAAKWYQAGHKTFKLSINISARQLLHPNLMSLIKETLLNTQFPPELLVLELTESSIMSASQLIEQTIQDIAAMRIGISLDDFGTGYSSLSHLKRFTISTLKIDRSFVEDMTLSTNNNLVVKSILALSHILKLDVIAEGIETEEQLQLLLKNKCQYGQGFYFSKPITDDEMGLLLHRERDMDHKKKPQSNEP